MILEELLRHVQEFTVRSYEVDAHGRASPAAVCNWLQEVAGVHATKLGWSVHQLGERGLTWVLARLKLRLERPLTWGETVRVETWPAGAQRLYAIRDFRLTAGGGGPVGVATTGWMLINLESRRPVRPPQEIQELNAWGLERALVDDLERFAEPTETAPGRVLEVRHADLDVNGHANNVSVISWLLEALEAADLARPLCSLEVEFRGEAVRGDRLVTEAQLVAAERPTFLHRLHRVSDGREAARARTVWS